MSTKARRPLGRQKLIFIRPYTAAFFSILMFGASFVQPASAQVATVQFDQAISALQPEATGNMVRSMSQSGTISMRGDQQIPDAFDFARLDAQVGFDSGSHILNASGMVTLRTIAEAMNSAPLAGSRYQIGAHVTSVDAVSAMPLSSRRAQAVLTHLVTYYGISPDRLENVGYGNSQPYATNPALSERISIINIDALQ